MRSKFGSKLPVEIDDTCIILGNGPSLKQSLQKYPDIFKKYPLICVNSFSITEDYIRLKPAYYVLLDPGWWLSKNEWESKVIETIKTNTSWKMTLFVPFGAKYSKKITELEKQNSNITVHYFNYTVFKGFKGIAHFLFKKDLAMPQCQNVLVASIFLSINLKFKNVYLLGSDHTWHEHLYVNEENILCAKHVHFYENEEEIAYVPFYKGAHTKEVFKVHEIFTSLGKVFLGYEILQKYAQYCKVNIYNATEISFIDSFERKKLT
ncbi:MAG: DUF115 domain-containing protein [Bacteroidetes bacterium]|nr:DUF115 domain-containing protein [Bacteroidota bacterium]